VGRRRFDEVQRHLAAKGLKAATGTIVDATIIAAPSSTKNAQSRCRSSASLSDLLTHTARRRPDNWLKGLSGARGLSDRF
jgi:hypothetical protein